MRRCRTCKKEFPLTEDFFYYSTSERKWFAIDCKSCVKERATERRRNLSSEQRYRVVAKSKYKLTEDQINKIMNQRVNGCEICSSKTKLCIDHNHTTGEIRGVLCHYCNQGIGNFKDNSELLERAKRYLLCE